MCSVFCIKEKSEQLKLHLDGQRTSVCDDNEENNNADIKY
jgi:hypothetical protein